MNAKKNFSHAFKTVIIICCLIGILSNILKTSSIPSILSFYTMQSNLAVLTFYFICMIISEFKKNLETTDAYYFFKGGITMIILLTFVVYIVALFPSNFTMNFTIAENKVFNVPNIMVHIVVPLLVLIDYFVFDEKGHLSYKYPIMWAMFPVLYIIYVYCYSMCGGRFFGSGGSKKYAYFFLDVDKIGFLGVAKYLIVIASVYLTFCYLFILLDKVLGRQKTG